MNFPIVAPRPVFTLAACALLALFIGAAFVPQGAQERQPNDPDAEDTQARVEPPLVSNLIGSKHDFSRGDAHPRDLCLPCHAPHLPGATPPLLDARPATTQPVRPYGDAATELDAVSVLCLSCHDGVIATDVFTSTHATRIASQLGGSRLGAGGLRGHPVGTRYPDNAPKYHPAAQVTADGAVKLPGRRLQCRSCHDPHNTGRHAGMLVKSNDRSRLCLTCHRL